MMLPRLAPVTEEDLHAGLAHQRCAAAEPIELPLDDLIRELNVRVDQVSRAAGSRVESLRNAQVGAAVAIMRTTARQVRPPRYGLAVGFSVAERWLSTCGALVKSQVGASWASLNADITTRATDPLNIAIGALEPMVADPLTVFVAGPITGASATETDALVAVTTLLRAELVQLRVRLYSAPEEADARIHRDFADAETWRDVDEHWIRRSDLVVILHPRAATGLGIVHEIAGSACVPVLLVADQPVSPMMARRMTPERLLESHNVVEKVLEYIAEHGSKMIQRRHDVRIAAARQWRRGRLRLRRDIEALSNESLTAWQPSTITRARLQEVTSDDYAYGSLTDFERLQLRQAFHLAKLRPLDANEYRALRQAARNHQWTDDIAWQVELSGRQLLATAEGQNYHYARPHDPSFWEAVYRDLPA